MPSLSLPYSPSSSAMSALELPVASSVVWKMACNIHGGMERKRESDSKCNSLNVSRQTERERESSVEGTREKFLRIGGRLLARFASKREREREEPEVVERKSATTFSPFFFLLLFCVRVVYAAKCNSVEYSGGVAGPRSEAATVQHREQATFFFLFFFFFFADIARLDSVRSGLECSRRWVELVTRYDTHVKSALPPSPLIPWVFSTFPP